MILANYKKLARFFTAVLLIGISSLIVNASQLKGEWKLVEAKLDGEKVVYSGEIKTTLEFGKGRKMFGNSGCNRYTTTYRLKAKRISFEPFISTKMACREEEGKQEGVFSSVIERVDRYRIKGKFLTLSDGSEENVLRFVRKI